MGEGDVSWFDNLSSAWGDGPDTTSSDISLPSDNTYVGDLPTVDAGSSIDVPVQGVPATPAGQTVDLFAKLAGTGLQAVKTYEDLNLQKKAIDSNAMIQSQALATRQQVAASQNAQQRVVAGTDAQVAALKGQAAVAAQKFATLLSNPVVLIGGAVVAAFAWKMFARR